MSQKSNQQLIARVQKAVRDGQRTNAIAKAQAKNAAEMITAEIDLLLDDARAEGIAPDSPMELAIVMARYVELLDKGRRIPRASFALPGD
jgi:hypothetical protein